MKERKVGWVNKLSTGVRVAFSGDYDNGVRPSTTAYKYPSVYYH